MERANELLVLSGRLGQKLPEGADPVQLLIDGLDRAALAFLSILENDDRDQEGHMIVDFKTRVDIFKMAREWLVSRYRATDGDEDPEPGKGFDAYKNAPRAPQGSAPRAPRAAAAPEPEKRGRGRPRKELPTPKPPNTTAPGATTGENLMDRMKMLGFNVGDQNASS